PSAWIGQPVVRPQSQLPGLAGDDGPGAAAQRRFGQLGAERRPPGFRQVGGDHPGVVPVVRAGHRVQHLSDLIEQPLLPHARPHQDRRLRHAKSPLNHPARPVRPAGSGTPSPRPNPYRRATLGPPRGGRYRRTGRPAPSSATRTGEPREPTGAIPGLDVRGRMIESYAPAPATTPPERMMTLVADFSEEYRARMARTHWMNRTLLDYF